MFKRPWRNLKVASSDYVLQLVVADTMWGNVGELDNRPKGYLELVSDSKLHHKIIARYVLDPWFSNPNNLKHFDFWDLPTIWSSYCEANKTWYNYWRLPTWIGRWSTWFLSLDWHMTLMVMTPYSLSLSLYILISWLTCPIKNLTGCPKKETK